MSQAAVTCRNVRNHWSTVHDPVSVIWIEPEIDWDVGLMDFRPESTQQSRHHTCSQKWRGLSGLYEPNLERSTNLYMRQP
jgi:hypothetical protein